MALTGGEVQLKTEGAVATLTLSNGPYTVITWEMRQLMAERFAEIDADRQIRVVVVRSAGKHFSSGSDIAGFMEVDPVDFTDLGHNVTAAARSPKPVIAVIDGYWFGVGLVIALSCDIRLATARSEFALPEVKLGMIPGSGGTQRLARLIGLSTAAPTARFTPASSWSERRMPCSAPVPTSPRAWPPLPRSASPASRSGSADEGGTVRLRAPGHH